MDMFIEVLKAFFIGVVEGITEWLPISSTGHMILVDEFVKLNVSAEFLELFLVVIQLGAIMAVLILYFHKLNPFSPKKTSAEKRGTWRLWGMVAIALIIYGVVFILLERRNRRREAAYLASRAPRRPRGAHARPVPEVGPGDDGDDAEMALFRVRTVDEIDWKTSLKIGCFQMLAIIPGTSRSGSTIIGGMLCGCSRTAAAEFTFFLAIPVMFGWGVLKLIKYLMAVGLAMTATEIAVLVVGIVTAFVVSVISIKFLMGYIKKNDFTAFGVYRIIVGLVVLAYFGVKVLL